MTPKNALQQLLKSSYFIDDPGDAATIHVEQERQFGRVPIVTGSGAETRTLGQPTKPGLFVGLILHTDGGGDCTVTVTGGYNQGAETTFTLADEGDRVLLESVETDTACYWRVICAEGVAEMAGGGFDIHVVTAGTVPDVADLVPYSDESATGDPTLVATVTQLLTAAGDLTDLAAVPAVDDRILLTDESATGDPAKSTTVENLFSALGDVTALAAAPAVDDLMVCTDESAAGDPIRAITVAQLFQTYFDDMTPGAGISGGSGTICEHRVTRVGGLYKTEIMVDLTGLNSGDADGDIIGKAGTAACHIGQITAAKNGTIFAGRMTCFESPTGGEPDIDVFSATVATGTEETLITDLEDTALLIAAADWAAGDTKLFTAFPAADAYLYLVASGEATNDTYTAGILLIELWGK